MTLPHWCNCYACREYFDGCQEREHDVIKVRHLNGAFYWGDKIEAAKGQLVNLCENCQRALAEDGENGEDGELEATFGV